MSPWSRLRVVVLVGVSVFVTAPSSHAQDLTTVLVQYEVDARDYRTFEMFRARIESLVAGAVERYGAELVVFPEYVSTLALFTEIVDQNGNLRSEEIPPEVRSALDDPAPDPAELEEVHDFVADAAARHGERVKSIWQQVARRHGVWILAGSGFVPAGEDGIHNRVWVINNRGRVVYMQDKVFLTEYERDVLGVVPGEVEKARPFEIEGIEISVTICRDSYFEEWEERFATVDAWIDVRGNGEAWDDSVRRRFDAALPERIAQTDVDIGLSTSLNGRFFDFLWQGPAFVVGPAGDRLRQSPTVDGDYLMVVELDGS